MGQARLGWRLRNRLSGGVELGLLQGQLATKQWTATTEVRLSDGHKGTNEIATIAVELGSAKSAMVCVAGASFRHYGPAAGGPETLWKLVRGGARGLGLVGL